MRVTARFNWGIWTVGVIFETLVGPAIRRDHNGTVVRRCNYVACVYLPLVEFRFVSKVRDVHQERH